MRTAFFVLLTFTAACIGGTTSGTTSSLEAESESTAAEATLPVESTSTSAAPGPTSTGEALTTTTVRLPLGAEGCDPPSPTYPWGNGLLEVEGTPDDATSEFWALVGPGIPLDEEYKILFKATGINELDITAVHESGMEVSPVWVADQDQGSTWNRRGREWGTGWVFEQAGCWDFTVSLNSGDAHIYLIIGA